MTIRSARSFAAASAISAAASPARTTVFARIEGDPVEQLTEASAGLDLLVVGSRRYGPLRSALLGGVSGPLIERAACPVLVLARGVHVPAGVREPAATVNAS